MFGTARRFLIVFAGLALLLAWLVPDHRRPWPAFYADLLAFVALLLLATALFVLSKPRLTDKSGKPSKSRVPWPFLVLAATACIPLLQYAFGIIYFRGDAMMAFCFLWGLAAAYLAGYQLGEWNAFKAAECLAALFLTGGLVSFLLAIFQWLGVNPIGIWLIDLKPGARPYGNMAQPNQLATLLAVALASALFLWERGRFNAWIAGFLSVLLLVGLAMTQSRTPLVMTVFFAAWFLFEQSKFNFKLSPLILSVYSVGFIMLWFSFPFLAELLLLDAQEIAARGGMHRLDMWAAFWDAVLREPITGYGWNQVSVAQTVVAVDHPGVGWSEYSHNFLLDLMIWNGLVVGLGLSLLLGGWFLLRLLKCPDLTVWYALLVLGLVAIHGLVEFPLAYAYFLLPLGLLAGLVDSRVEMRTLRFPRSLLTLSVLAGWMLIVFTFLEYQKIESDNWRMRMEKVGYMLRQPEMEPAPVLLTHIGDFNRFARSEARRGMSDEEVEWMRKVTYRYPMTAPLLRYANVLALHGRYEEAGAAMVRLRNIWGEEIYQFEKKKWEEYEEIIPELRRVELP